VVQGALDHAREDGSLSFLPPPFSPLRKSNGDHCPRPFLYLLFYPGIPILLSLSLHPYPSLLPYLSYLPPSLFTRVLSLFLPSKNNFPHVPDFFPPLAGYKNIFLLPFLQDREFFFLRKEVMSDLPLARYPHDALFSPSAAENASPSLPLMLRISIRQKIRLLGLHPR